jgi:hypothetical protein
LRASVFDRSSSIRVEDEEHQQREQERGDDLGQSVAADDASSALTKVALQATTAIAPLLIRRIPFAPAVCLDQNNP